MMEEELPSPIILRSGALGIGEIEHEASAIATSEQSLRLMGGQVGLTPRSR